jgi:hypothetical protein
MSFSNYTAIMGVDAVTELLDGIGNPEAEAAKEAVESITFMIGIKGQRFPDYVAVKSLKRVIDESMMRYIESMVTTQLVPNKALYYIGNPDH